MFIYLHIQLLSKSGYGSVLEVSGHRASRRSAAPLPPIVSFQTTLLHTAALLFSFSLLRLLGTKYGWVSVVDIVHYMCASVGFFEGKFAGRGVDLTQF